MSTAPAMKTTALVPAFGGNRVKAELPGRYLGKLKWCGVLFAGGMPELPHIRTAAGVACDKHRHVINLARVVRTEDGRCELIDRLDHLLFHPDELADAQRRCLEREVENEIGLFSGARRAPALPEAGDVEWAADYYVCSWMGRGGHALKATEFTQGLALRYTSSGGDSAKRWRSAIESLEAWSLALRVWSFTVGDALEILDNMRDQPGHGLYADPPWPDAGEDYAHKFSETQQRLLARKLERFEQARVVVRYGDHPLIRELYPTSHWYVIEHETRNQQNNGTPELLIVNGPAYYQGDPQCRLS